MTRLGRDCIQISDVDFQRYYKNLREYLIKKDHDSFRDDYFTKHDKSHCCAIEKIVNLLLKKSEDKCVLSDLEKFLLLGAIWSHDLGMLYDVATGYFVKNKLPYSSKEKRQKHDLISAWHLSENYKTIFQVDDTESDKSKIESEFIESELRSYIDILNIIIKYHRRATDVDECPKEIYLGTEIVRCRLLACLLRLGDTLHIDSSRFDEKTYNLLEIGDFDRYSRLHWLKSYVVSNVYLDPENQLVHVNIDLPEVPDNNTDWAENVKNLKFFIRKDIQEDLLAVSKTFREYRLPVYLSVCCNINQVPGFNEKLANEVVGVLNDLDLIFSPNSTRAIKKTLSSIRALGETREDKYEKVYNQFEQLLDNLKFLYEERPCHVGLNKIITEMNRIFENLPAKKTDDINTVDIEKYRKQFVKEVDIIEKKREGNLDKIFNTENGKRLQYLNGIKNVFLFGYSELVSMYLESYAKANPSFLEDASIYVFEGASKRRYSSNNIMEYNDGIYYSVKLSRIGFKKVTTLPDVEFASVLNKIEILPHEIKDPAELAKKIAESNDTLTEFIRKEFTLDTSKLISNANESPDTANLRNACANLLNRAIYLHTLYEKTDAGIREQVDAEIEKLNLSYPRTVNHIYLIKNLITLIKLYSNCIKAYQEPHENSVVLFGANGIDTNLFSTESDGDPSISEKLIKVFKINGYPLCENDSIEKVDESTWEIADKEKSFYIYRLVKSGGKLQISGLNYGYCGHSSGHLTLAIVAKEFKIPVVVIADSFKFGDIRWNLLATRETNWATTQDNFLDEIKDHKIRLINYREDMIPPQLLTIIISDSFPLADSKIIDLKDLWTKKFDL